MDDESFDHQIEKMEDRLAALRIKRDILRRKFETEQSEIARLEALHAEEVELKREIADLEGRPYHDEDEPDDFREPPDPADP